MKYTVIWKPDAEAELANIWTEGDDRDAVRRAADALDAALAKNPMAMGESRIGDYRITFAPPLGVEFRVVEDDRQVFVVRVWRIR